MDELFKAMYKLLKRLRDFLDVDEIDCSLLGPEALDNEYES